MNRQGSGSKVGRTFEEELNHNNETYSVPPARSRRSRLTNCAPVGEPGLSNTAIRPRVCNTVLTRAKQKDRSGQQQQKPTPGRPKNNKGPQPCSSRSPSPGTTAGDRNNIKYGPSLAESCQMTDITLYATPNSSSIVSAIVHYRTSNRLPDLIALSHKYLGEQGKFIRITQLSADSWELLGYRCGANALGLCNRGSLDVGQIRNSYNDAASHGTDHSDDDWSEEGEHGEQDIDRHSPRTHIAWLPSDEVRLLSYKDNQDMGWKEIFKRFPDRTTGAVRTRYHKLHM
jgi:hypothetical protein